VELRGLEPLTPTLPGRGTSSEQGVEKARGPVSDVVRHVPVVTVVVKTVVGTPCEQWSITSLGFNPAARAPTSAFLSCDLTAGPPPGART
jgi:hypothetical protein